MEHLHAFSKNGKYQDCGPVAEEYDAYELAQQNVKRLNEQYKGEDVWGVEIERPGRKTLYVGHHFNHLP